MNSLEKQSSHQQNCSRKLTKKGLKKEKNKNLLVLTSLAQTAQMLYEGTHSQSLCQGHPQICGNGLEHEKNTQTKTQRDYQTGSLLFTKDENRCFPIFVKCS